MGRRWPTAADDFSYRRQPRLQLRRLRPGHRRAR
nr:hypothetical protein [Pseudomonas fluorescens]